ncbi:MAG: serine/threonine protein kinase [Planctomycetes bacterium RBG_13_63_9]|nr:MAG: serine/threonine protein kinase [Planctomycetes bacterium RBG_13_63_9]
MPRLQRRPVAMLSVLTAALVTAVALPARAENWPQWRGPSGDGVCCESGLPIAWSEQSGLLWKCPLPEWGTSTPAIWGDAIFVTSHEDDQRLLLLRIDKATGTIEWTRQVGTGSAPRAPALRKSPEKRRHQEFHRTQNLASPSPVTDGEVVVAHFGNGDLAAYDFDGRQLWCRNLQKDYGDYTIWWGHANSPVLHQDLVISVCMQDSCRDLPGEPSESYVVAHDKRTGMQKWKTLRTTEATQEHCDAYTTPIFRQADDDRAGGRLEMVVMGGQVLDAYDPATGQQSWRLAGLVGNRVIPNPVAAQGMIYATQGMSRALLAVSPDGDGEQSRERIVWQFDQGTSDSPSPVVWGEHLYFVTINGIARSLDAQTGQVRWKERLKGEYYASPIAAEGRIYFLNMEGLATVVSASPRFDRLTLNQLDDETIASPAVSDGKLFLRGRKWLYCLGK